MQKNYPKKRMLNKLKASLLLLMMVCFAIPAQAQTRAENDFYIHNGTEKVERGTIYNFYDFEGPCANDETGTDYWNQWYSVNKTYTYTLRPKVEGDKIKVTFKQFKDWEWNNSTNAPYVAGYLSLQINDDYLTAYSGTTANPAYLITELTGSYENEFTIMSDGAITFTWVSNEQFRGAGWTAQVEAISGNVQPQAPYIYKDKCENLIRMYPTTLNCTLYYSTDGTNFSVYSNDNPIPWPVNQETMTVYAKSIIGEGEDAVESTVASLTFGPNDRTPVPTKPKSVYRIPNTNTILVTPGEKPSGLQETWYIGYTTAANGGTPAEPSLNNAIWDEPHYFAGIEVQIDTIEVLTPNTSFRFKTRAYSCDQMISTEYLEYLFSEVYVPAPTINANANTTISMPENFSDAIVKYTIDGSDPTTSATAQIYNGGFAVTAGATIRAYAYKTPIAETGVIGYMPSDVVTEYYVPGSGADGSVVLLDDREDHSWSYYSDGDQPVHSLNPADVKITYFGNGTGTVSTTNGATPANNSWTQDATSVQVSYNETENTFIYLKTLERANYDGTGNCPYTVIPNPFSKRPTYQYATGDLNKYCGFYAWRLKAVRGGEITGKSVGDTINAETTLTFVPSASKGMEVELEALWARAYVKTGNANTLDANNTLATNLDGGSYERNFFVITSGNTDNAINRTEQRPVTITNRYPDGTSGGSLTSQIAHDFTCNADTKFEYIVFGGTNRTITANNHYLCTGRGVTGTMNRLRGIGATANGLNYTLRIESGTYTNFSFVNDNTGSNNNKLQVSGTYFVKSIMGCDYDRAKKVNSNLSVSPSTQLFYSTNVTFSGSDNKDQKTFDCVFKSGSYQSGFWGANVNNNGDYQHSAYLGQNSAGNTYPGMRYVVVEGGEFGSMNGGRGVGGTSTTYASPEVVTFDLRIKGGLFHGCVYGAAADNPSIGSRRIVVTGGEIRSWLAGGCNGTGSTNESGATNGNSFIYIGGSAIIGGSNASVINGTAGGQIFGAGRGLSGRAGSMLISNVVIGDNANISNNVYGGGYNSYIVNTSNVHILGGTIQLNVFGGSYGNGTAIPTSNVFVKGGKVNGSVYGGSNDTGTVNNSHVTMTNGEANNVYGGGFGPSTIISQNTAVTVSGGIVGTKDTSNDTYTYGNVYGGGEEGVVNGSTDVTVSGGTLKDVFGAGKGNSSQNRNANVAGNTKVLVSGGTLANVYGGGEEGTINSTAATGHTSTVTVTGNNTSISGDVFGAGKMGRSTCNTIVTVANGNIGGNVFGGALGAQNQGVFHAGLKTVNILGGHIRGSVYGGSRNAHDALKLTGYNTTESDPTCVINFSAGQVDMHVYAAGYYGSTYGSTYVFVGVNAIENAPFHAPLLPEGFEYGLGKLDIKGNIWAGGDWGVFAGTFGAPTISGNSNVYVDGSSYGVTGGSSEDNYMNIEGSLMGCGTSCDAGNLNRDLIVKDYGNHVDQSDPINPVHSATRSLNSIQRFKRVALDRTHLALNGQGRYNSLVTTEKYSIYGIVDYFYMCNGSTLVLKTPASELKSFGSVTISDDNIYAMTEGAWSPSYTTVNYDGLGNLGDSDNKIRVEGGSYVEVKYLDGTTTKFGELRGFFHMMSIGTAANDDATCAYARPKTSAEEGNDPVGDDYQNPDDGGFVSYRGVDNEYDADGGLVETGTSGVQLRYVNHTENLRGDTQYFRVWQYGGIHHTTAEGMLLAKTDPTYTANDWLTVSCEVILPRWTSNNSYFRFETLAGNYANIEYGDEVMTFNAASATEATTGTNWMYCAGTSQSLGNAITEQHIADGLTEINDNKDLNFGLVVTPGQGMVTTGHNPLIICDASNQYLAAQATPFECADYTAQPKLNFRLTYSNKLTANKTLDPVIIHLVQCHMEGEGEDAHEVIDDYIAVPLVITTSTQITQGFETKQYAIMDKQHTTKESSDFIIVLPAFTGVTGDASTFKVKAFNFVPDVELDPNNNNEPVTTHNVSIKNATNGTFDLNSFGLTMRAGDTYDQKNVWETLGETIDFGSNNIIGKTIGKATGRTETGLNFTLWYNEQTYLVNQQTHMGTVTVTIELDKYVTGYDNNNQPIIGTAQFDVTVEVWRKGRGDNFYIDGIAGQDKTDYGKHPDRPAATFNFILNRAGYTNGDHIFIVNKVTIANNQMWDGTTKTHAKVYRYPGKHELFVGGVGAEEENLEYTGTLIDVTGNLILKGVSIDGVYAESQKPAVERDDKIYPETCSFNGLAEAPIIDVLNGGSVNLTTDVDIQSNFNNASSSKADALLGGAIRVEQGGMLRMNDNASITENYCSKGAGVYMDGGMIVSDAVNIYNNKVSAATNAQQSNVWLTNDVAGTGNTISEYKVVQVGTHDDTDEYDELVKDADLDNKIGIDKSFGEGALTTDGFLAVVYTDKDPNPEDYLDIPYAEPQNLIVHDLNKYNLEKYLDKHFLYWLETWVTFQTWNPYFASAEAQGYTPYMTEAQLKNISTPEQLAWVISLANGENGVDFNHNDYKFGNVVVTNDIDMNAHIWVPMGTDDNPFAATFDGNGHVVTGIHSPLVKTQMGMFGITNNATIGNLIANVDFKASADNMGAIAGTMNGGTLSNVEAAGILNNKTTYGNMGGLVGHLQSGTIHSAFSVTAMEGGNNMGGLVGLNEANGNLYNAYSNVAFTGNTPKAGLIGTNKGKVENCYVITDGTPNNYYEFAVDNTSGSIKYSYAKTDNYILEGTAPVGSGTYGEVLGRKAIGYMYADNAVDADNDYVADEITYDGGKIATWPGLLSTLNQWVAAHTGYTPWFRPTSGDINGDLPVLGFTKDNSLATEDGKFLYYGSNVDANGLDNLFTVYNGKTANMFLYGNATDVTLGNGSNPLFINEDAVLLQKATDGNTPDITATVGVTFDNSCKKAVDHLGNTLKYDWHFMSSSLQDAPINTADDYDTPNGTPGNPGDVNITGLDENCYFPNDLPMDAGYEEGVKWDLYTYYEPQYHWINLKRNDHWHQDNNDAIEYTNETQFVPGKGYMMAISQDSYMNSTGKLNNGPVSIAVTNQEPENLKYNKGWNLVGNPYQAYLDLSQVQEDGTFYIYDADKGVFAPVVDKSSANTDIPSKYIHPHQGFFMYTASDATFEFLPTMAGTQKSETGSYYRGREDQINYPLVNIYAENEHGNRDLAVVEFNRPELGGATKVNCVRNTNFQIAASLEGQRYGLVFTPEGTERVPVHFITEEDGTFTLTWNTQNGEFTSLLLVDNMTGTITDMLRADHYTFESSAEDYASRFYLTYTVTGVDENGEGDGTFAFFDGSAWVVNGKGQLDVVDVQGRTLYSARLVNDKNRVSLNGVAAGVYLLRVSDGTNTMVQKIVVR